MRGSEQQELARPQANATYPDPSLLGQPLALCPRIQVASAAVRQALVDRHLRVAGSLLRPPIALLLALL